MAWKAMPRIAKGETESLIPRLDMVPPSIYKRRPKVTRPTRKETRLRLWALVLRRLLMRQKAVQIKLLRVISMAPTTLSLEMARFREVRGPKMRSKVPKMATVRPIFSCLVTFSLRKITPPIIVIIGPVAERMAPSREVVSLSPSYKGISVKGVPSRARTTSSQILSIFLLKVQKK